MPEIEDESVKRLDESSKRLSEYPEEGEYPESESSEKSGYFKGSQHPKPLNGLSTHIASDRWTIDDTLGYDAYAYAIYKFITNTKTKPPLTISIQAPWGGGKTSLMRMIQKYLDPDALKSYEEQKKARESGTEEQTNRLKVKDMCDELKKLIRGELPTFKIEKEDKHCWTIWFNAWKYGNTEQVWAGLADEIIRQFAEQLDPIEREKFWFYLYLRRLDTDKIRRRIHESILTFWLHRMYPWLLGSFSTLAAALTIIIKTSSGSLLHNAGFGGVIISASVGLLQAVSKYFASMDEPAETNVGEYVRKPDYSAERGFVANVEEDLKRVFELIPDKYGPLVIFIDDLDRCLPDKVVDAAEAINLFLAGEFKKCIFVLGMDPGMVAAALEEAHSKVIAKLPADNTSIPIGWRFMDKFVQLRFVIPPAEERDLEDYARSLLSEEKEKGLGSGNLKDETISVMNRGIESFSDQDSEISRRIMEVAPEFSNNPRDLKRFFNIFRFLWFLRWAREAQGRQSPSLSQLQRWIMLLMKWPGVVRWLRCSNGGRQGATSSVKTRLSCLEDIAKRNNNLDTWKSEVEKELQLNVEKTRWVSDAELLEFFKNEKSLKKAERLSTAAGMGLW